MVGHLLGDMSVWDIDHRRFTLGHLWDIYETFMGHWWWESYGSHGSVVMRPTSRTGVWHGKFSHTFGGGATLAKHERYIWEHQAISMVELNQYCNWYHQPNMVWNGLTVFLVLKDQPILMTNSSTPPTKQMMVDRCFQLYLSCLLSKLSISWINISYN